MKKSWKEMKEKWGSLVLGACVVVAFFLVVSNIGIVWKSLKYTFDFAIAVTPTIQIDFKV